MPYGVRGPRAKRIIFPEDSSFVSCDNIKLENSKLKYFSCKSKKGERNRKSFVCESFKQPIKISVNPDNFCTNMKIYLFFIILDISQLKSYWCFYFQLTVSQHKHTKEGNPFVNMYKEGFDNIQLKQRPFPFIEGFLYLSSLGSKVA